MTNKIVCSPLTPAEVNALQGRELDAAVAEWMGCTVTRDRHGNYLCGCGVTCDYPHSPADSDSQLYGPLNCYSADVSAMYEVEEEVHKRGLTDSYVEVLFGVCNKYYSVSARGSDLQLYPVEDNGVYKFIWNMLHATPEQRARAVVLMAQETAAQDRLMHQMSDGDGRRE